MSASPLQIVLLVLGIAAALALCGWISLRLFRELATGWAIDERRRGKHWTRGSESMTPPPTDREATPDTRRK